MKKLFFILFIVSQSVLSQSADELFVKANELYKQEKFQEAIKLYSQIEEELGLISSELYYNLGNCYYKLNKIAPSIYNYEKALLIDPLNEDAQNNLVFARRSTIDNIEELPKSVLQKLDEIFIKKLSYNQWAIVCVVSSILGTLLFLLFYFSSTPLRKRIFFVTSMSSFFFLVISLATVYKEYDYAKNHIEAIVFSEETDIKNAPTTSGDIIFTLHEGTKVYVLDTVDNWKKIRLADGKIGWIQANEIKVLSLF